MLFTESLLDVFSRVSPWVARPNSAASLVFVAEFKKLPSKRPLRTDVIMDYCFCGGFWTLTPFGDVSS